MDQNPKRKKFGHIFCYWGFVRTILCSVDEVEITSARMMGNTNKGFVNDMAMYMNTIRDGYANIYYSSVVVTICMVCHQLRMGYDQHMLGAVSRTRRMLSFRHR